MNKNITILRIVFAVVLIALVFRVAPIPRQSEGCFVEGGECIVTTYPSWQAKYAREDGSFMIFFFAGCVPWKSCAINEPTDWWIGGY